MLLALCNYFNGLLAALWLQAALANYIEGAFTHQAFVMILMKAAAQLLTLNPLSFAEGMRCGTPLSLYQRNQNVVK